MVAPLIVGTARVVGTKTAARLGTGTRARNLKQGSDLSKQNKNVQRMTQHAQNSLQKRDPGAKKGSADTVIGRTNTLVKRVRATAAATTIFWTAITFFVPQIAFWLLGIVGLSIELQKNAFGMFIPDMLPDFVSDNIPDIIPDLLPGDGIYMVSWLCIAFIGISTMLYALLFFMSRKVNCFGGWKGLIFLGCLTGYMVMFINIFPWFVVWIASVAYLQDED